MRPFLILIILLSTCLLSACGAITSSSALDSSTPGNQYTLPPVAGLPEQYLTGEGRRSRGELVHSYEASDLVDSHGAVMVNKVLNLSAPQLSYAVLGTNLGGGQPTKLTLSGTCQGLYVGLSDFGHERWQWLGGPLDTGDSVSMPSGEFTSANGSFYIALICPDGAQANLELELTYDDGTGGSWNLLIWMAADNDLADSAFEDIQELESVGSREQLNILVGYDISPEFVSNPGYGGIYQVRFIRVVADSNNLTINTSGHPANQSFQRSGYDSSNPDRLVQFLDWANANFPAEHNALVLWNHGDGWRRASSGVRKSNRCYTRCPSGILSDETDGGGSMTPNSAVAAALADFHFDLILFDACNMAHIEALYEYYTLADWLVASEVLVPYGGYPYSLALNQWLADAPLDPAEIGQVFVDNVKTYYEAEGDYINHALIKASQLSDLGLALASLAAEVTDKATTESEDVKQAIQSSFEPELSDGARDLCGFLSAYQSATSDSTIQAQCAAAQQIHNQCVTYFQQYQQPSTHGIAAWLPNDEWFTPALQEEYSGLVFDHDTGWLEMLKATGVPQGNGLIATDWSPEEKLLIQWSNVNVDIDLWVYDEPDDIYTGPEEFSEGYQTANLLFSQGSSMSGNPQEWVQLKPGADPGNYYIDIEYFWYDGSGPAPDENVQVKLLNPDNSIKQDLGILELEYEEFVEFAKLVHASS